MRDVFAYLTPWTEAVTVLEQGEERPARAFLEPLSATRPEEQAHSTPAGVREARRYRMIASPGAVRLPGAEVRRGEERFAVLRSEDYGSHVEALLERKAGSDHA